MIAPADGQAFKTALNLHGAYTTIFTNPALQLAVLLGFGKARITVRDLALNRRVIVRGTMANVTSRISFHSEQATSRLYSRLEEDVDRFRDFGFVIRTRLRGGVMAFVRTV